MPRDNDQDGTPQGVFGAELRYYRERAGLSQTELAALVNVSHDVISKIETGERPPAKDFPERLDAVPELDSRGGLSRLWGNLRKGLRHRAIPGWFQPWAHVEAEAAIAAVLRAAAGSGAAPDRGLRAGDPRRPRRAASRDDLDDQVAARMDRQAILDAGRAAAAVVRSWTRACCTAASAVPRSCTIS